jgi:hypothetical protein
MELSKAPVSVGPLTSLRRKAPLDSSFTYRGEKGYGDAHGGHLWILLFS